MSTSGHRLLRAAWAFALRPLLLAAVLVILIRMFSLSSRRETAPRYTKALVIASTSDLPADSVAWIGEVSQDWDVHNYIADAPTAPSLSIPVNKGNEAMVYLTYIIDHYDALPDIVFFHHSHLKAWHQEMDSAAEVALLRPSYVVKKGYASARCLSGCENIIPLADYSVDPARMHHVGRDVQLTTLLDEFLERDKGERVPKRLAAPCCAQFAASREAIRARSREWWLRLRQWLIDTPLDNLTSGRLLEHTWHKWLGEKAE